MVDSCISCISRWYLGVLGVLGLLPDSEGYSLILQSTRGYQGIRGTTGSTAGYCGIVGALGVTTGYPAVCAVIPVPHSALQGRIVLNNTAGY